MYAPTQRTTKRLLCIHAVLEQSAVALEIPLDLSMNTPVSETKDFTVTKHLNSWD